MTLFWLLVTVILGLSILPLLLIHFSPALDTLQITNTTTYKEKTEYKYKLLSGFIIIIIIPLSSILLYLHYGNSDALVNYYSSAQIAHRNKLKQLHNHDATL